MSRALKITKAVKDALFERAGIDGVPVCEKCGNGRAVDPSHRRPKGMGGTRIPLFNSLANLVAMCRGCHDWIEHDGRITGESYSNGWLVKSGNDPRLMPVAFAAYDRPVMLDEGGSVREATDAELIRAGVEGPWGLLGHADVLANGEEA